MSNTVVSLKRIVRRMRGGAQAQLAEAVDGHYYIVKWVANPQGTRTLINEWLAHNILTHLKILTPEVRIIHVDGQQIAENEDLGFRTNEVSLPIQPGFHFGSQCPVDPEAVAVYDFFPTKLLSKIVNLHDFTKALVFDVLLGQADRRQAIFVRNGAAKGNLQMRAYMIDNGLLFGGASWQIRDAGLSPLYFDKTVYSTGNSQQIYEEAIDAISEISEPVLKMFVESCPSFWLTPDDRSAIIQLSSDILKRISRVQLILPDRLDDLLICRVASVTSARRLPPKMPLEETSQALLLPNVHITA